MQVTITATLTPEQIHMLATQKGYQETLQEIDTETGAVSSYPNTQSKSDFIRQVYEGIILGDATREVIAFRNKMKEQERIAEENAIREAVANSITSSI
jgi:hypothetical protein